MIRATMFDRDLTYADGKWKIDDFGAPDPELIKLLEVTTESQRSLVSGASPDPDADLVYLVVRKGGGHIIDDSQSTARRVSKEGVDH